MLYDNAQLARVYLHAWQVTGNGFFRTITEEILDYVVREMTAPAGGFYSTQDADSEGEEGKFFVWTPGEIREVLGDEAGAFMTAYGVTLGGNFEGKNILEFVGDMEHRPALAEARRKLFEARENRVHPGRDEKILTSWNGLMLAAFAEAARVLDRGDGSHSLAASYRQVAERKADFLPRELRQEVDIAHQTLAQMQTPSGGGMMSQYPLGFGQWLQALAYALSKPREIAIVGDLDAADTRALLNVVRHRYRPFQVVALSALDAQPCAVPLLQDRGLVNGQATAYVCQAFACQAPVTKPAKLQAQLAPR
jgi:uncharacterized protein YyaL (SSP411 family)